MFLPCTSKLESEPLLRGGEPAPTRGARRGPAALPGLQREGAPSREVRGACASSCTIYQQMYVYLCTMYSKCDYLCIVTIRLCSCVGAPGRPAALLLVRMNGSGSACLTGARTPVPAEARASTLAREVLRRAAQGAHGEVEPGGAREGAQAVRPAPATFSSRT